MTSSAKWFLLVFATFLGARKTFSSTRTCSSLLALLLGVLSLFAAAPAVAQDTTVWSATLTVKNTGVASGGGCSNSVSGSECSSTSTLTDDDFTYDSVDYEIVLVQNAGTFLSVRLNKAIPASLKGNLTLHVGSSQLALADAELVGSDLQVNWPNSGLSWSVGDTVSLKLTAPPPPTVSLSASPNPVLEGSVVTVTVTLSHALSSNVSIPLTMTAGSAETGDYVTSLAAITVNAGDLQSSAGVRTNQDDDEDDETFTIALGTLPSSVTAGNPSSVTVTIRDTRILSVEATPACSTSDTPTTVTDMSVQPSYALTLTPAPTAATSVEVRPVATNERRWRSSVLSIGPSSGRSGSTTRNPFSQLRDVYPGFEGFEFRLANDHDVKAKCTWTFSEQTPRNNDRTFNPAPPPSGPTGGGPSPGGGAPPPATPSDPTPDSPCGESDREYLERFYEMTNGEGWDRDDNWNSEEPLEEWFGVDTDDDREVVSLRLPNNNLSGDMPTEEPLCLAELKELALWGNDDLEGEVPDELVLAVERAALRDIAETLDINPGWFEDCEEPCDFEDWYTGVTTDDEGRVTGLDLTEEGVIGELPESVSELRRLGEIMITTSSEDGGCALNPEDGSSAFGLFLLTLLVFAVLVRKRAQG